MGDKEINQKLEKEKAMLAQIAEDYKDIRLEKKKRDNEEIKAYLISAAVLASCIVAIALYFEPSPSPTQLITLLVVAIIVQFPVTLFYWVFGALGLFHCKNPEWWHLTATAIVFGFVGFLIDSMFSL